MQLRMQHWGRNILDRKRLVTGWARLAADDAGKFREVVREAVSKHCRVCEHMFLLHCREGVRRGD